MAAIDVDVSSVNSEDDLGNFLPAGRFHAEIVEIDDIEKDGTWIVKFKALAGTVPACAGKMHTEYFSLSTAAMPRVQRLLLATGVVEGGSRRAVDPRELVGRQLIIETVDHEFKKDGIKKQTVQISFFGMFSLSNPKTTDVPRNPQALKDYSAGKPPSADQWATL